ncbi:unnamed protein product, partial [Urochloa humidicola]
MGLCWSASDSSDAGRRVEMPKQQSALLRLTACQDQTRVRAGLRVLWYSLVGSTSSGRNYCHFHQVHWFSTFTFSLFYYNLSPEVFKMSS